MPAVRRTTGAVVLTALVALTSACGHGDAAKPDSSSTGAAATGSATPGATPSGYADMKKKVDAAESAASAADRDATSDADR